MIHQPELRVRLKYMITTKPAIYRFKIIEQHWRLYWQQHKTYQVNLDDYSRTKFYVLDMFPYPSASGLHVGHPRGYCASDLIARMKRLQGYHVLHPIGWDAFGLPAEQYALKTKKNPATFTNKNIKRFRLQLQRLGFSFDYDLEINTSEAKYYKWTQWFFILFYQHQLANIKTLEVNWCEELNTVLANEEIINVNGLMCSERGQFPVVKKTLPQWVLSISAYAPKLLSGLKDLNWPAEIKKSQQNWIGQTPGWLIDISTSSMTTPMQLFFQTEAVCRTTPAFIVSYQSVYIQRLHLDTDVEYQTFLQNQQQLALRNDQKSEMTGKGFKTKYLFINPITNKPIPLYVCKHFSFAHLNYIFCLDHKNPDDQLFCQQQQLQFIVLPLQTAINLNEHNSLALRTPTIIYRLRDWIFSRQRFWGEPFPVYYSLTNKLYLNKVSQLPIKLPNLQNYQQLVSADGQTPLARISKFYFFSNHHQKFHRDPNTMPQWAGSCWYFIAYLLYDKKTKTFLNPTSVRAQKRLKYWLPVDFYIGGKEHAVLHLLYARFWHRFLFDIKIVPTAEPFQTLFNQGLILGDNNEKMSKSTGNVVNPNDIIDQYGADSLRLYEMFMGPVSQSQPWETNGVRAAHQWLKRVLTLFSSFPINEELNPELTSAYQQMITQVTADFAKLKINTAISSLMVFINHCFVTTKPLSKKYLEDFVIVLSCICPFLAEELWHSYLHHNTSVTQSVWPTIMVEQNLTQESYSEYIIMLNGKLKLKLKVSDFPELKIHPPSLKIITNLDRVKNLLFNQTVKNTIIVKNIINFVVNNN